MRERHNKTTLSIGILVIIGCLYCAKVLCTRTSNRSFLENNKVRTLGKKRLAREAKNADHFDEIISDTGLES